MVRGFWNWVSIRDVRVYPTIQGKSIWDVDVANQQVPGYGLLPLDLITEARGTTPIRHGIILHAEQT